VSFHAQQASEKALKAFPAWHDRPLRKTRSLEEIGEACLVIDASLCPLIDRAAPLSEYAWRFRCLGDADDPTREESAAAFAIARDVLQAAIDRLPADIRLAGQA
jgi:hypothetical protein